MTDEERELERRLHEVAASIPVPRTPLRQRRERRNPLLVGASIAAVVIAAVLVGRGLGSWRATAPSEAIGPSAAATASGSASTVTPAAQRFGFIGLDTFTMSGPFPFGGTAYLRSESDPTRRATFDALAFVASPDGRQVAYWHAADGRQDLRIFAAASPDRQQSLYSVPSDQLAGGIIWAADASALLFEQHKIVLPSAVAVSSTLQMIDLGATIAPLRTVATLANGRTFRPLAWDRVRNVAAAGEVGSLGATAFLVAYDVIQTATEPVLQRTEVTGQLAGFTIEASADARYVLGVDVIGGTVRWWPMASYVTGTTESPRSGSTVHDAHWRPGTTEIGWGAAGSIELHDITQPQVPDKLVYRSPDGPVAWDFRADGSAVIVHASVGRGQIPPAMQLRVIDLASGATALMSDEGIWGVSVRLDPPASATPSTFATPVAAVAVPLFRALGRLAFSTSTIGLQVLDGASGRLQPIDAPAVAQWSPDGSWLAYVRSGSGAGSELWLSRADGSGRQQVRGLPAYANVFVEWSPTDDVLAVIPQGGAANGLWLVRPDQTASLLASGDAPVWDAAWSPDGQSVAYSVTLPFTNPIGRSDALFTAPARGGAPTQRLVADNAGLLGIEWWPDGRGLLYFRDPQHSASLLMDGVPLESLVLDGSRPGGAFADRQLAVSGQWIDDHRFVAIAGIDRWPTGNKNLAICDIQTMTCTLVAQAAGSVALEPALSPDRSRVAFVRALDRGQAAGFGSEAEAQQWITSRTLWILDLGSGQAREVQAAGRGVLMPAWSADGNTLLLTRGRAAWLFDLRSNQGTQLIAPLDPATPFAGPGWTFAWQR